MELTHRQRVILALRHEETDRVPLDFGGGPATQIHPRAYAALLGYLGLDAEALSSAEGEGQVVTPSERVLERFDIDVRGVMLRAQRGREEADSYVDEWGVVWRKAEAYAPYIAVGGPLQTLARPSLADVDRLAWPSVGDASMLGAASSAEHFRTKTDCAVVLNLPNASFALCQRIRGFAEFFEDLLLNRRFAEALLEKVNDRVCTIAEAAVRAVGTLVDCVAFPDDLGTQAGPMISPHLYREMVRPHHARLVDTIRAHTSAFVIMHSDGAIADFLTDLIDIGIDGVNPVQTSAAGMDPALLKRRFGTNLCFWGGIDTHHVLPRGTVTDVANEVRQRIGDLGQGGGFVLASVHNIQAEVPPQNIVTMFDTARELASSSARGRRT